MPPPCSKLFVGQMIKFATVTSERIIFTRETRFFPLHCHSPQHAVHTAHLQNLQPFVGADLLITHALYSEPQIAHPRLCPFSLISSVSGCVSLGAPGALCQWPKGRWGLCITTSRASEAPGNIASRKRKLYILTFPCKITQQMFISL